ncbi:MAG TPA: hypothetical protein VK654_04695 [Nitrospirota bacterium]|nr:hypothetical protein [Nitrospirota bacterium]
MHTFEEIAAGIVQQKQTGLLSIVAKNSAHHVKIFFNQGEIYHLLFGNLKDADCLNACQDAELMDYFYSDGIKVSSTGKFPIPSDIIIDFFKKCLSKKKPAGPGITKSAAEIRTQLETALTRQIGPIAKIIFSTIQKQWHASSSPTSQEFQSLIELIAEKIEDASSKKVFTEEARRIIA